MELIPPSATIHYRVAFDIENDVNTISYVRKMIRKWMKRRLGDEVNEFLGSHEYFNGTSKPIIADNATVRIASNIGKFDNNNPEMWVVELIHADSEDPVRLWSVEIGLVRTTDNTVRFALANKYWTKEGYILTRKLADPKISTPAIVKWLINDNKLTTRRGKLGAHYTPLQVLDKDYQALVEFINFEDRELPLILFMPQYIDGEYRTQFKLNDIALSLAANALVVTFKDEISANNFNYLINQKLRCLPGAVRVYAAKPRPSNLNDANRHRFFTTKYISEYGTDEVVDILVDGLSRNGKSFRRDDIYTIEQLYTQRSRDRMRYRIEQAKIEGSKATRQSENSDEEFSELEKLAIETEEQNANLIEELDKLKNDISSARSENQTLKHIVYSGGKNHDVDLSSLYFFPNALEEIMENVLSIYPDRIAFTERAYKSAGEATLDKKQYPKAWDLLNSMATVLHDIFFVENNSNVEGVFLDRTGFELSMKEGKTTKKNPKMKNDRLDLFEGQQIDISPHTKFGSKNPNLLRIYFHVDNDKKRLIIGHCGDHLVNATTRKI